MEAIDIRTGQAHGEDYSPEALAQKELEELAQMWAEAHHAEKLCSKWRLAVEQAFDGQLGHKPEGATTHKVGPWKVTMRGVLYRKLDPDIWMRVRHNVPRELWPIQVVEKLDERGCKWLAKNRPDVWAIMAEAVTTKPGKTGVKVVRREGE